jgi:hypothetical protein
MGSAGGLAAGLAGRSGWAGVKNGPWWKETRQGDQGGGADFDCWAERETGLNGEKC